MSGLSGPNNETIGTDNIEKVAGTTGLVGYANTYISLQAVNGIFFNGIGSGNSANTELPFSNEADANGYISGLTNGDFWISGQNGGAVIKSCNRSTPGPNGEGIGSIHINSANGDVVVNVTQGNFESNVAANVINSIQGNTTSTTHGNLNATTYGNAVVTTYGNADSLTYGNVEAIVNGTLTSVVGGNMTNVTAGLQWNFNFLNLLNLVVGAQENINLLDLLNLCVGAQENFNIGPVINGNIGPVLNLKSFHLESADADMKAVQAKLDNYAILIENASTVARDSAAVIQSAGIHVFT